MVIKKGSLVYWKIGRGKGARVYHGRVTTVNTQNIAPNSVGVRVKDQVYYPLKKIVRKVR